MSEETKEVKTFTQEEVNALLLKERTKTEEKVTRELGQTKEELERFKKTTEAGLSPEFAKYIQDDEDIEFFKGINAAAKETKTQQTTEVQRFVKREEPKDAAGRWAQEVEDGNDD